MKWFSYNILFAIGYTLMLPKFLLRMWRRGGYRKGFLERFARYSPEQTAKIRSKPRIWVHAVSVGEVFVALRFIEEFRAAGRQECFVLTTTTSTGHAMAKKRLAEDDVLLYFPADFPLVVRRALRIMKPRALILTESELWPNIVRECFRSGIPVGLINGRISESSYKGYKALRYYFSDIIGGLSAICVQGEGDKRRLVAMGAANDRVEVVGTTKYDVANVRSSDKEEIDRVLTAAGIGRDDVVILGGSTWPGEEAILLGIYADLRKEQKNAKLVLVPRHFERAADVIAEIQKAGMTCMRRSVSGVAASGPSPDVLVVDSTGELAEFYARASLVFVGKSLTAHGGQNIIEPAMLGKPIIVGPNMENFEPVMQDFLSVDAIIQVADEEELRSAMLMLASKPEKRDEYGKLAAEVVRSKQGVVKTTVRIIERMLG